MIQRCPYCEEILVGWFWYTAHIMKVHTSEAARVVRERLRQLD